MPVDHDLQRDMLGPTHHAIEQVGSELPTTATQQFRADILIELFGVDEQPIQIKGHGLRTEIIDTRMGGRHAAAGSGDARLG